LFLLFLLLMKMKTLTTLLFVLAAVVMCVVAHKSSGQCESITWEFDDVSKVLTFSGQGELSGCKSVDKELAKTVVINEGITYIGENEFELWVNLESIVVPESVTVIGNNAFRTSGLKSFHVTKSLEGFYAGSFWECGQLAAFTVDEQNPYFTAVGNVVYSKDKKAIWGYPPARAAENYRIPDGITKIEDCCFQHANHLKRVYIPDGVTSLGYGCFFNSTLTSINLPGSIQSVDQEAFFNNTELTYVSYRGNSEPSWHGLTFDDCPALEYVCVGPNYTSSSFCGRRVEVCNLTSSSFPFSSSSSQLHSSHSSAVMHVPFVALVLLTCIMLF